MSPYSFMQTTEQYNARKLYSLYNFVVQYTIHLYRFTAYSYYA